MHIGHYISGAGHLGLIGWLLLGGLFSARPEPFEMTEVSVISGAEFDAMIAATQAPASATEVAQPAAPSPVQETPDISSTPDEVIEQPAPVQTEAPPDDPVPEVTELSLPPETEVDDTPPDLQEPVGDIAVLVPEVGPQAIARPVDRVAPEAIAQPDPDATPDPVEEAAQAPDEAGETEAENQDAQAPEEATTEIVTEATQAPAASSRPPGRRPAAPAPRVVETPAPSQDDATDDAAAAAIAAAVAEAQTETAAPTPAAPSGPPLSAGEKESLRVAVSSCWNVGSLSSEALQTTVVVSVAMNQNGTPIVNSIQMESSSGGSTAAARQAFEAARRAVIRCGSSGYDLPSEKFGQWQNIEMTFNPERMRVK